MTAHCIPCKAVNKVVTSMSNLMLSILTGRSVNQSLGTYVRGSVATPTLGH